MGARLGSQWVLIGYSVSTPGTHGYSDCSFLSTQGVLRQAPPRPGSSAYGRSGTMGMYRYLYQTEGIIPRDPH